VESKPSRRKQARSRVTRTRILDAALELTQKQGFERTSMAEIAREAGIGQGTLYHHFADKRALLLEFLETWGERVAAERRADLELGAFMRSDPRAFLEGFLHNIYERLRDRNWLYVELFLLADRDEELRARLQNLKLAGSERLATIIEVGQQRGLLRKHPDPTSAGLLLANALELFTVHVHMLQRPESETQRMFDELTDMICRYLVEDS
jgi:AcrR family transcriptional regulator